MNHSESEVLLKWLAEADIRHRVNDEQMRTRIGVWADLLSGVDFKFAMDEARKHYRKPAEKMITPGIIKQAWQYAQQREREDQRRDNEQTYRQDAARMLRGKPEWFDQYRQMCDAARVSGEPMPSNPFITPRPIQPGTRPAMLKSCKSKVCACTHTECTNGWLDDEFWSDGYMSVRKCPVCVEGLQMSLEGV